jgi:hypothetical protein
MNKAESQAPRMILNPEMENLVFSPYTLRLMIGLMAFVLPPLVVIITAAITISLSAAYHTAARDVFVGFLFIIGALLLAYNGRSPDLPPEKVGSFWKMLSQYWKGAITFRIWSQKLEERVISFIGGLAAFGIALVPSSCPTCEEDISTQIHFAAGAILFSAITYFCLVAFTAQVKHATERGVKKRRRARIYMICGWGIVLVMFVTGIVNFTTSSDWQKSWAPTFWAETIALMLFGFSWMTASKVFTFLADEEEQHHLTLPKPKYTGQEVLTEEPANAPLA